MAMQREIQKLIAIKALRSFVITMPIFTLYVMEHGLSIQDLFVLQVIFSVAIVLLEVPTGYFADRFGRKPSIVIGCIFIFLGFGTYTLMHSMMGFAMAEILLACSVGFISGADSSFLFETLRESGREKQHIQYQGRLLATIAFSECLAALAAFVVLLFAKMHILFVIQTLLAIPAILLALSLKEPVRTSNHRPTTLEALQHIRDESARLRRLNVFAGCLAASTLVMVWFAQPVWVTLDIPVAYFGLLWGALQLIVVGGALIAHRIEQYLTFSFLFGTLGISIGVLYIATAFSIHSVAVVGIIALFWLVRGISNPILQDYVNREAPETLRATVFSLNSLYGRMIFSVFSPFLGWVADVWSLQIAFYASACILGTLTLGSFLWWSSSVRATKQ